MIELLLDPPFRISKTAWKKRSEVMEGRKEARNMRLNLGVRMRH